MGSGVGLLGFKISSLWDLGQLTLSLEASVSLPVEGGAITDTRFPPQPGPEHLL